MSSKKKQKQVSIEEYIEVYCQEKRIRGRFAVYISPETHHNLKKIAQLFRSKHHSTTSSLAESIISCHIETYRELLENVHKEDVRKLFGWQEEKRQSQSDESESYREDDEV